MIALIPLQVALFSSNPPPDTAEAWLELFVTSPVRGLLAMDALYLLSNVLLGVVLLALYVALAPHGRSLALAGLTTGMVSIATYFPTNKGVELWQLSTAYSGADAVARDRLLAAAESQLAEYTGTGFAVYYILGGVCILLFATNLLRSRVWGRQAAWTVFAAGILMLVPSTAGAVGMVFSLLSLIPWVWFCVLAIRRLWS